MRRKIDAFRKETKKSFMAPIDMFEAQVFDVLQVIAEVENPLIDQLKKYETDRKKAAYDDLMVQAKEEADRIGLRQEFFNELMIESSWLNKTARRAEIMRSIFDRLDHLKEKQNLQDDAERVRQMKIEQISVLCQTLSEKYSLRTPLVLADVPGAILDMEPGEIIGEMEGIAHARAEIEYNAMQEMQAMQENQAQAEARRAAQAQGAGVRVVLEITGVTPEALQRLRNGHAILGCEYRIVEVSE